MNATEQCEAYKRAVLAEIREGIAQFWLDHPEQDFKRMIAVSEATLRFEQNKEIK